MKNFEALLRPSFYSTQTRPYRNAARAYMNFAKALRSQDRDNNARVGRRCPDLQRLGGSTQRHLRCLGTSSAASEAVDEAADEASHMKRAGPQGQWPRMTKTVISRLPCQKVHEKYSHIEPETPSAERVRVCGRVWGFRIQGNKLAFVDLMQEGVKLQIVCNYADLKPLGVHPGAFKEWAESLKRGDFISVTGVVIRTLRRELSVLASELPLHLSSCLRPLPTDLKNEEARMRLRHVDLLITPKTAQLLRLGADIKKFLRRYLENKHHISVKTPILASAAGGAVAKPFTIISAEKKKIALRIAPELWLKRLIIGGFERVYEIGPSFRDEGYDNTHNPEFETCEFYRTFADLEELIDTTEHLLHQMSTTVNVIEHVDFTPPLPRLDFIPALETRMNFTLPNLDDPTSNAVPILTQWMDNHSIKMPEHPTLPHLLDKLASHYLEPECQPPTWIIHPPSCLSPLSKSFTDPHTGQAVAARAELFARGQEIVNTYEEENSPIAQREKFRRQRELNGETDIDSKLDESYLEALEYGMPPTGGWGCGIERLTMLFGGANRIADTLAFGTLKNVMGLGSHRRTPIGGEYNSVQRVAGVGEVRAAAVDTQPAPVDTPAGELEK